MIPKAVQHEVGRILSLTFKVEDTNEVVDITGRTITGLIETIPGPEYISRVISGDLSITNGAGGVFEWTLHGDDTTYGEAFSVQFTATYSADDILKSIPERWVVVRSIDWP